MSYAAITPFSHGETLVASKLTQLAANLDAVHDRLGDVGRFFPAAHVRVGVDHDRHALIHRYRWLQFQSDGELVDPANSANTINLNEESEPTTLDLNTVDWLYPGKVYFVRTCTWCREVREL